MVSAGIFAARDNSGTSGFSQIIRADKALRVRNNSDTNNVHVSHKGQGYFASSVGIGQDNAQSKLQIPTDGEQLG